MGKMRVMMMKCNVDGVIINVRKRDASKKAFHIQ